MIVPLRDAKRVEAERKTQHRLEIERRAPGPGAILPISYRQPNEALGYDAIGNPRKETIQLCRVRILERWGTVVGNASHDDIEAEGYKDIDEFREDWPEPGAKVWVIRFELVPDTRPRLLSGRIIAGHQGDYVTSGARAIPGDPGEAIEPWRQDDFSRTGRRRDLERAARRRDAVDKLPFDLRLEVCVREARSRHIDIRDELRAIERWTNDSAREKQLRKIADKLREPIAA